MAEPAPGAIDGAGRGGSVEASLARLDDLAERPVAEHVAAYDAVHRALQDQLAVLDQA